MRSKDEKIKDIRGLLSLFIPFLALLDLNKGKIKRKVSKGYMNIKGRFGQKRAKGSKVGGIRLNYLKFHFRPYGLGVEVRAKRSNRQISVILRLARLFDPSTFSKAFLVLRWGGAV